MNYILLVVLFIGIKVVFSEDQNVLGNDLQLCSLNPVTGFDRRGYCTFLPSDPGTHVVCAKVNQDFLDYTKSMGNDLSTSRSYFPGLKAGDRWCICVFRWRQAYLAGHAPEVVLNATHWYALVYLSSANPALSLIDLSKFKV